MSLIESFQVTASGKMNLMQQDVKVYPQFVNNCFLNIHGKALSQCFQTDGKYCSHFCKCRFTFLLNFQVRPHPGTDITRRRQEFKTDFQPIKFTETYINTLHNILKTASNRDATSQNFHFQYSGKCFGRKIYVYVRFDY